MKKKPGPKGSGDSKPDLDLLAASIAKQSERVRAYEEALAAELSQVEETVRQGLLPQELVEAARMEARAKAHMQARLVTHPVYKNGAAFKAGRAAGADGPMKKLVRKMLKRVGANVTARALWAACKALPEQQRAGIEFYDSDAWVDGHSNCSFRRFSNIMSEVRRGE